MFNAPHHVLTHQIYAFKMLVYKICWERESICLLALLAQDIDFPTTDTPHALSYTKIMARAYTYCSV